MFGLPNGWSRDVRVAGQVRQMWARALGLPASASAEEVIRAMQGRAEVGTAKAMGSAPWCRRYAYVAPFELEVYMRWWNYYVLRWRRRALERHLELITPCHILARVRPCLW